jgi:hypothetical protein
MATCFVAARTNNNVMLYCVDFFRACSRDYKYFVYLL